MHNPIPKNANFFIIILFLLVISTIYLYSISAEYITNSLIFQMKGWRSQFFHCKCPFSIFPPHIEWIVFVFHTLRQQNNRNFISFQRIISKKRLIATIFSTNKWQKSYLFGNYKRCYLAVQLNRRHIDIASTATYHPNRRQHYYKLPAQALSTR